MPTKPETASDRARSQDGVITLEDLEVHFSLAGGALSRLLGMGSRTVKAVDGINLTLEKGEVLGLVGESGSGKSTLGRALLGLAPVTGGRIVQSTPDGERVINKLKGAALRQHRTDVQMIFQDPSAALNPTMTIGDAVGDPLRIHGLAKGEDLEQRVSEALERVGLAPAEQFMTKYPADLSGGQKQRAVIARAIILDPQVLVADEPVSMLDMSVRAKILELMLGLKNDLGLTYVYITHDLATAKFFCDRVAIMYLGRIVEIGPTEEVFANPRHPYTQALLKAIPEPDPTRAVPRDLPRGEIPDAASPPLGCAFHPRCPVAVAECGWETRDLRTLLDEHWTRRSAEVFEQERSLVGDLDALDKPSTEITLGKAGDAEKLRQLLEGIRDEQPDEPFWTGVEEMEPSAEGLRVKFHSGTDPGLRPVGESEVACVRYGDASISHAPDQS